MIHTVLARSAQWCQLAQNITVNPAIGRPVLPCVPNRLRWVPHGTEQTRCGCAHAIQPSQVRFEAERLHCLDERVSRPPTLPGGRHSARPTKRRTEAVSQSSNHSSARAFFKNDCNCPASAWRRSVSAWKRCRRCAAAARPSSSSVCRVGERTPAPCTTPLLPPQPASDAQRLQPAIGSAPLPEAQPLGDTWTRRRTFADTRTTPRPIPRGPDHGPFSEARSSPALPRPHAQPRTRDWR